MMMVPQVQKINVKVKDLINIDGSFKKNLLLILGSNRLKDLGFPSKDVR